MRLVGVIAILVGHAGDGYNQNRMVRQSSLLDRVIEPHRGDFSAEHARYVLSLDFSPAEHARYADLSSKAQDVNLSADEEAELDDFLLVNTLLMVLQSKARISLAKHNSTA